MIEARELGRRYGDFTAVEDISFSVDEGEIVGILGPNGAGKTTTIRMITGFLPPSQGQVTVAGLDLLREPLKARRQIGYLPESVALYPEMRVREYLSYRGHLEGMSRGERGRAIGEVLERCLLEEVEGQIIGTLSKGYRQRVGLATAILHRPEVLVLDEPTVGLDPRQIIAIRELIRELGRQRTLLLSTHILPEVELLCDRVLIIDRGRLVAQGTPEDLRRSLVGSVVVGVTVKGAPDAAPEVLGALPGVEQVSGGDAEGEYLLECAQGSDPREDVFRAVVDEGWVLTELTLKQASLEDVFVRLTTRDGANVGASDEGAESAAAETLDESPEASEEVPS